MAKSQTSFSPIANGFQFANYFEFHFPVKYNLPFVGTLDLHDIVFGLCGGMCASALDYFYNNTQPPADNRPDQIPSRLFTYLCERQLHSLSIPVLLKIIEWTMLEDSDLAARMVRTEIPKLRRSIDSGKPVILCLIRVKGINSLTSNHQVLAVGYEINPDGRSMTVNLYDPNHPCEEPNIQVGLSKTGFAISQSTGEPLRGIFIIPYTPSKSIPETAPAPFEAMAFDIPDVGFQLSWPVDSRVCTQRFGEHPENYRGFGLPGHEGLDLLALDGANVYACADGEVFEAGPRPVNHPYGIQVRLKHLYEGQEYHTVYAHLREVNVKVGQQVKAGQLLGKADSTGNSTGAHLHLTLKQIGAHTPGFPADIIDPWPFLQSAVTPPDVPPPSASGVTVYTNAQLNLRDQPSANDAILTTLPVGEALAVLGNANEIKPRIGQADQWLQVQTAAGQVGYVAAWLVVDTRQEAFPPSGVIVYPLEEVNLRSGPGTAFELLGTFTYADPLNVLGDAVTTRNRVGQSGEWLQVQAQNGQRGFVAAWLVRLTGQVPPATNLTVFPTTTVNVRSRPSTDANMLTMVAPGDALTILGDKNQAQSLIGQQDQWLNIRTPNNLAGFVAAWLVQLTSVTQSPSDAVLTVYPTADLNLRAQPSANAPRLDGAYKNETLQVIDANLTTARAHIGQQDQWLYVQKQNGSRGWAAAWYLSSTPD